MIIRADASEIDSPFVDVSVLFPVIIDEPLRLVGKVPVLVACSPELEDGALFFGLAIYFPAIRESSDASRTYSSSSAIHALARSARSQSEVS